MERSIELGFCDLGSSGAYDMHDVTNGNEATARLSFEAAGIDTSMGKDLGTGWLEAASPVYNISPNIKDYVIVPIILCPSGLPNRNAVAFSLQALGRFDHEVGCLGYQTWKHKPTFYNHDNSNHEKAKGVIFDTRMLPIRNTNNRIWKVVALAGFDRTVDPVLANSILTGEFSNYSMGASVGSYECAVCGHRPNNKSKQCEHMSLDRREMKIYDVPDRGRVLSHYVCDFVRGFELSCVHPTPAWASANSPANQLLSLA